MPAARFYFDLDAATRLRARRAMTPDVHSTSKSVRARNAAASRPPSTIVYTALALFIYRTLR